MRVIGGKHRGRVLRTFEGQEVRPTSDRAKESLFNILQKEIPGCRFLDLFAGSGSVGIEALSRGAAEVWFCDCRKESVALCKDNLRLVKEDAVVIAGDYTNALQKAAEKGVKFDVIFLDPPYASPAGEDALKRIAEGDLLQEKGVVVYENAGREPLSDLTVPAKPRRALVCCDRRKYGAAHFDFYREEEIDG